MNSKGKVWKNEKALANERDLVAIDTRQHWKVATLLESSLVGPIHSH